MQLEAKLVNLTLALKNVNYTHKKRNENLITK